MAMAFRSAVILFSFFPFSSPAIHSLKYHFITTSGITGFPQFLIHGYVNDMIIFHYDNETRRAEPRQEWMNDSLPADYWDTETKKAVAAEQIFRKNIEILKRRFNQNGGEHTVQYMYGCKWNDQNGEINGFMRHGYDGEDFLKLDVRNKQWIGPVMQAILTAKKWNRVTPLLKRQTDYLTQNCTDWLNKYLQYGNNTLRRTVPPNVSVFETQGTGPVCHATGFYPEGVMITWKKDGEEIVEDVIVGETLPNEDGTFQKRVVLTLSPEELQGSGVTGEEYTCEVTHRSGIQTVPYLISSTSSMGRIIGPVIGLLVITAIFLLCVFLFVKLKLWRCKNSDHLKKRSLSDDCIPATEHLDPDIKTDPESKTNPDMISQSSIHSESSTPSVSSLDFLSSDQPLIHRRTEPLMHKRR